MSIPKTLSGNEVLAITERPIPTRNPPTVPWKNLINIKRFALGIEEDRISIKISIINKI